MAEVDAYSVEVAAVSADSSVDPTGAAPVRFSSRSVTSHFLSIFSRERIVFSSAVLSDSSCYCILPIMMGIRSLYSFLYIALSPFSLQMDMSSS